MKKLLILLISVLIFTGCSVDYDIVITDKEQVNEKIVVSVSNDYALKKADSVDEFLGYYSSMYEGGKNSPNLSIKTKKGKVISKFIATNSFANLNDYVNSTSFLTMFSDASIERVGDYVTFKTSNNEYLKLLNSNEFIDEEFYYEDFKINIKFYNKVTSSNADSIDEKNNIYTWDITKNNPKEFITFRFSSEKRYDIIIKDWLIDNLLPIVIIGTLIVVALLIGLYIAIVRKKNDRI